jgi:HTH-type transcriptional regulator/antitoxin HipB
MSRTIRSPRHEVLRAFLVERRRAAGLTQAQVASTLARPQSYVATVEQGDRRVDVVTLLDFAEAIGFDPRDIIASMERAPKA